MAQQRDTRTSRGGDPFAGAFSQERVSAGQTSWPVLQWHGGLASLVGDGDSVKINGGFFIEDDRIIELGLDPREPAPGFERVTLRLGGNQIPGWGASELSIAVLLSDFNWEDRESGRLRFPPTEYERRKQQAPGTERELRGRTRCLVGVRELMEVGVLEPLVLSVRGSYSAALNAILRGLSRMADEATRMRRASGHEGSIPREAFWMPIYAGPMELVGEGVNTSRVSLPKAEIPDAIDRNFLIRHLVDEMHRRPGGTFDQWAEQHTEAWEARNSFDASPSDSSPEPEDDGAYEYPPEPAF